MVHGPETVPMKKSNEKKMEVAEMGIGTEVDEWSDKEG